MPDDTAAADWAETPPPNNNNGTIIEENDDEFDDDDYGNTVHSYQRRRHSYHSESDSDGVVTFRHYDNVDHDAALTIHANQRA